MHKSAPRNQRRNREKVPIFKTTNGRADELYVRRCATSVGSLAATYPVPPLARHTRRIWATGSLPQKAPKTAWLRCVLLIGSAILALLFPSFCVQAQIALPEDDVRAAVLFHLTQFVEWPDRDEANPYRICVAESAPASLALERFMQGKSVRSRPIWIQQIAGPTETQGCQIVFIARCARPRLQQYLISLRDSDILTVGEQPGFIDLGGMIQLALQPNRVGLVVNLESVQRSHLTVSSKLLRLGHRTADRVEVKNH